MQRDTEFLEHVTSAYAHLYDLVYLRTHPLADLLVQDQTLPSQDRAWEIHHTLMAAIDELDPGTQAPVFSHEWRRHRLMVLRYVDGLDPSAVAKQLAISRRQYYREHEAAIEATAAVLWDRYIAQSSDDTEPPQAQFVATSLSRVELLRLEAARTVQAGHYANLAEVMDGVLSLWRQRLAERRLQVELALPEQCPRVSMEPSLLRQLLLGMMGHLIERAQGATVRLSAKIEGSAVELCMSVTPAQALEAPGNEANERIAAFRELAALGSVEIGPVEEPVTGFRLRLSTGRLRTVLVVDDNEDVLELFRRYLVPHQYEVAMARTAHEALTLARRLQPQAITLDLMMPEQDGWDLLRLLLDRPDTRDIPVIVCSVLPQREAALSLGATAFLPKPVTEEGLLSLLDALTGA